MKEWQRESQIMRLSSAWVSLVAERWLNDSKQRLEYWRVEKADSVIVIPICKGELILLASTFRPGVGCLTMDFPGGRVREDSSPRENVSSILARELGVPEDYTASVTAINNKGWAIDSSFSSQRLWGFEVEIDHRWSGPGDDSVVSMSASTQGLKKLLAQLDCLQCRALLLEWAAHRILP